MAKALGSAATFTVGGSALENIKSIDFSSNVTAVDATDNDSAGKKAYLAGDEDGTCSVTCNYDPTATRQQTMLTNFYAKTTTAFVYTPVTGETYTFNGIITGVSVPTQHEATAEITYEIQVTAGTTHA